MGHHKKKQHHINVLNDEKNYEGFGDKVKKIIYIPTEKKIILSIVLATFLLLGGSTFILSNSSTSAAKIGLSQNVKLEVPEKNYNWGEIRMSNGNAIKTFTLKNSGTDVLKLSNIKTSCHCTKAQIVIYGASSPLFGMNDVSSWVGEVLPGKEAQLTVIFDPNFHGPTGAGPIERLVSVETNDPKEPKLEFSLTGIVVKD